MLELAKQNTGDTGVRRRFTPQHGASRTPSIVSTENTVGVKSVSLLAATCIVVANMVGVGIFTSLHFQVTPLPSGFAILVLWLVGGVVAFCGAVSYAELAAALPRSGGEYHFLSRTFHPAAGFLAGWLSATVGFAAPIALAAMAFATYLHSMAPSLPQREISLAIVALTALVHLRSVVFSGRFQTTATLLKFALIVAFLVAGVLFDQPEAVSFLPQAGDGALIASTPFAVSLVYVMYAYSGWNASTYIVGEVRDPARNIPLSVAIGTGLVVVLYLALNAVFLHVAPMSELAAKMDVGHVAASRIFGIEGGRIMAGLISIGLVSSISAMTWVGPRVAMAMGEDWRAMRLLARKSSGGVPATAMLVQTAIVAALLLTSTFEKVLTYVQFALQLCSFVTVLGVIVLRFTQPGLPRPYRTWGYPFTPLIFLAISGWMLVHIFRSNREESLWGLATIASGLVVYFLSEKSAAKP